MKKRLRVICMALLMALMTLLTMTSCLVIQAQKMEKVKGTYELTSYTRTSGMSHSKVTDYITEYGYVEYLVVTGDSQGYLVHKDNSTSAYSRKVFLNYTYDEEQTSKIARVSYSFVSGTDGKDMGVTSGGLNYSRPRIHFSDKVNQDGYSMSWKKVDKATDLSYAKEKLGNIREYDWGEYELEGIYSVYGPYWENNVSNVQEMPENPYVYYLAEIDAVAKSVRIAYLKKEEGSSEVLETKQITLVSGWNEIQIGGETWIKSSNETYEVIRSAEGMTDGSTVKYQLSKVRSQIGDDVLAEVITEKYPIGIYSLEGIAWNSGAPDAETEPENPYVYYFVELSPVANTIKVAYLKKGSDSEPTIQTINFDTYYDWGTITLNDIVWYREYDNPEKYYAIVNAEGLTGISTVRYSLSRVSKQIGENVLEQLITEKINQQANG